MKSIIAILIIVCLLSRQVQTGPLSCATCFGCGSAGTTGLFTAAGSCFVLGLPWLVCSCLGGLGVVASIITVVVCLPICLAPRRENLHDITYIYFYYLILGELLI